MSDLERFERSLRDKLSERSFPWEDGEMDQVGAVIAQHNATPTLRGALRWWHTAFLILPFAAVWWWSQASDGTIADTEHARSAQVEQLLPLVATEPTVTADEARLDATAQSSTSASAQERVATAHLDLSKNGMRHTAARHDPLLTQTEQASRAKANYKY